MNNNNNNFGLVIQPQFEGFSPVAEQQAFKLPIDQRQPQISETRIIRDISSEIKHNFREEIDKLRQEMNSQQRAFREQLDRLKHEAARNNNKNDAMAEIEKVKADLKAQRDAERMQEQNLFNAMNKYNTAKAPSITANFPISMPSQHDPA